MKMRDFFTSTAMLSLIVMNAVTPPTASQARQWFEMKKISDDVGEVMIYDEIGASFWNEDAVSAKKFDEDLKALGEVKQINLRINSPGGNVFDGIAIQNMLKNHAAKVTGYVDGIAASAASLVLMAADEIIMPENAFLLIHGASGFGFGMSDDFRKLADDLDRINKSAVATYTSRSKQKAEKIEAIMKEDRLMDAAEAKSLGLCDKVADKVKIAAKFSTRLLPKMAAEKFGSAVETLEEGATPAPPLAQGEAPSSKTEPLPTVPAPTNVVELRTQAAAEGRAEHATYVNEVLELCNLADFPAMAAGFIKEGKSVADVRAALVKARADRSEGEGLNNRLQSRPAPAPAKAWDGVIAKLQQK